MEQNFETISTNSSLPTESIRSHIEFFSLTADIENEDARDALNDRYFEILAAEEGGEFGSLIAALAESGDPNLEQHALDHLDLAVVNDPASAQKTWIFLLNKERTYFQAREMLLLCAADAELLANQEQLNVVSELVKLSESIANKSSTTTR